MPLEQDGECAKMWIWQISAFGTGREMCPTLNFWQNLPLEQEGKYTIMLFLHNFAFGTGRKCDKNELWPNFAFGTGRKCAKMLISAKFRLWGRKGHVPKCEY